MMPAAREPAAPADSRPSPSSRTAGASCSSRRRSPCSRRATRRACAPRSREADAALAAGRFVAGFLAYEAAARLRPRDPAARSRRARRSSGSASSRRRARSSRRGPTRAPPAPAARWEPALDAAGHAARPRAASTSASPRGDTYQVNFTFPLARAARRGAARALRAARWRRSGPATPRFVDLGRFAVASRLAGALLPRARAARSPRGR